MTTYRVTWSIDIDERDLDHIITTDDVAERAARYARGTLRDPGPLELAVTTPRDGTVFYKAWLDGGIKGCALAERVA